MWKCAYLINLFPVSRSPSRLCAFVASRVFRFSTASGFFPCRPDSVAEIWVLIISLDCIGIPPAPETYTLVSARTAKPLRRRGQVPHHNARHRHQGNRTRTPAAVPAPHQAPAPMSRAPQARSGICQRLPQAHRAVELLAVVPGEKSPTGVAKWTSRSSMTVAGVMPRSRARP